MARTPRIIAACLTLVAPLAVAAPAQAAHRTGLMLSVQQEAGTLSITRLKCDPPGGNHKKAAEACQDIEASAGDFAQLRGYPHLQFCTMELNKTTVRARGIWRGQKVSYSEEYSNPCLMRAATGPVFDY